MYIKGTPKAQSAVAAAAGPGWLAPEYSVSPLCPHRAYEKHRAAGPEEQQLLGMRFCRVFFRSATVFR